VEGFSILTTHLFFFFIFIFCHNFSAEIFNVLVLPWRLSLTVTEDSFTQDHLSLLSICISELAKSFRVNQVAQEQDRA